LTRPAGPGRVNTFSFPGDFQNRARVVALPVVLADHNLHFFFAADLNQLFQGAPVLMAMRLEFIDLMAGLDNRLGVVP
jgi:hypothetical protein